MELNANARIVLESRYLRRNQEGKIIETPEQMLERVALAVAEAELHWGQASDVREMAASFFHLMNEKLFLPNSPTLMNAGMLSGQLSACFVLPVEDDMAAIFHTLSLAALIQQSGGGTGFNFSRLRPEGSYVRSTGGTASGPLAFMQIYNAATEGIKQGGKRRGANMGILNVNHPDILSFIHAKQEAHQLENFNISVGIWNDFFKALNAGNTYTLRFSDAHTKPIKRKISAVQLWKKLIHAAWATGDPGLIFLDTIQRFNPTPDIGLIEATNPCGEVPLLPYESCNLGSINLSRMLKQNHMHGWEVDWEKLQHAVQLAIRFLDNVIEMNHYLHPELKRMAMGNRKIGLGVMGWAEMLIRLGIPYDSQQALQLASQLMQFIQQQAEVASATLARQRGSFPFIKQSKFYRQQRRNATLTSIAPTGTISLIAGTSSSIEPLFAIAYKREHVLNNQTLFEINPAAMEILSGQKHFSEQMLDEIILKGSVQHIKQLPESVKRILKTSLEIDYTYHIAHQISFQWYTDNAVSKTINMPESSTEADVEKAYRMAWQQGAKGITIFRYGSKPDQVLHAGLKKEDEIVRVLESEIHDCKSSCRL